MDGPTLPRSGPGREIDARYPGEPNMRTPIAFALALLLPACEPDPSVTFGLQFCTRYGDLPTEQTGEVCVPPGQYHGNIGASSIDEWKTGEPPPHLFLE